MSHVHIPDGVLPVGWWLTGYLLTALILLIAIRRIEREDVRKKVPFLGVVSALMLITMSVPVGGLPFHINLTVLTGILAGPWLGFTALFIVNLLLAFVGHGGITVVGINTLILGAELCLGWGFFQLLRKRVRELPAIGTATVVALIISTVLMLGVVGGSQAGWEYALPHQHGHEHGEHLTDDTHHEEEHILAVGVLEAEGAEETLGEMISEISFLHISGLAAIGLILLIGIGLEVLATVLLARFLQQVRPDLLR